VKRQFLKVVSLWLPPLLWSFVIYRFSSGVVPVASPIFWQDFTVKKTGHVLLFGVLAVLLYRGFRGEGIPRKSAAIWAVILATFYGATDEYHQMFTLGREARIRDVLIDGIGATIFIYFTYQFLPKLPKKLKIYAEGLNLL
jgi:hypothetical protein